jgi:transcriptional repressor NrdR
VICPKCQSKSKVYNSRPTDDGTIRRNRECLKCSHRYATIEVSADIKKVVEVDPHRIRVVSVAKPVKKQVVAKRRQKKKMYSASAIDRLSDDELLDALEKGLISPDDLD